MKLAVLVLVALGMLAAVPAEGRHHRHAGYHRHAVHHQHHAVKHPIARHAGRSLARIHPKLAQKVRQIVGACGAHINSGFRPGARVAGSGRMSRHAIGQAVDISGDYRCIYAQLRGWPSYSLDGPKMRHVHVSLGEGHFYHHGGHRYAGRHHRHQRWAYR